MFAELTLGAGCSVTAVKRITANSVCRAMLLWLTFVVSVRALNATSIVVIIRPDHVVIASDATSTIIHGQRIHKVSICKIYQTGTTFFAFSGWDQEDSTGFSASEIAERGSFLTLDARAVRFEKDVKQPLLRALQKYWGDTSNANYQKYVPRIALNAVFVGFENGFLMFQELDFTQLKNAQGKPIRIDTVRHGCPGDSCPARGHQKTLLLGQGTAATAEFQHMTAARSTLLSDDTATARHLVEIEIADQPDSVGPPVAVLLIDRDGGRWIAPGQCKRD